METRNSTLPVEIRRSSQPPLACFGFLRCPTPDCCRGPQLVAEGQEELLGSAPKSGLHWVQRGHDPSIVVSDGLPSRNDTPKNMTLVSVVSQLVGFSPRFVDRVGAFGMRRNRPEGLVVDENGRLSLDSLMTSWAQERGATAALPSSPPPPLLLSSSPPLLLSSSPPLLLSSSPPLLLSSSPPLLLSSSPPLLLSSPPPLLLSSSPPLLPSSSPPLLLSSSSPALPISGFSGWNQTAFGG